MANPQDNYDFLKTKVGHIFLGDQGHHIQIAKVENNVVYYKVVADPPYSTRNLKGQEYTRSLADLTIRDYRKDYEWITPDPVKVSCPSCASDMILEDHYLCEGCR